MNLSLAQTVTASSLYRLRRLRENQEAEQDSMASRLQLELGICRFSFISILLLLSLVQVKKLYLRRRKANSMRIHSEGYTSMIGWR